MNTLHTRLSGVLVHPTSFPSPYGIGDLGQGAYDFIDFLKASGQSLWQVLPLGPTGFGDSPYQSFSAFAGQSLLIDLGFTINKTFLRLIFHSFHFHRISTYCTIIFFNRQVP